MQSFFQFFGKFPSLVIATFVVIVIVNLFFRMIMRFQGKDPSFELNGIGPLIFAVIVGIAFFLVSMFYGPFSFIAFK